MLCFTVPWSLSKHSCAMYLHIHQERALLMVFLTSRWHLIKPLVLNTHTTHVSCNTGFSPSLRGCALDCGLGGRETLGSGLSAPPPRGTAAAQLPKVRGGLGRVPAPSSLTVLLGGGGAWRRQAVRASSTRTRAGPSAPGRTRGGPGLAGTRPRRHPALGRPASRAVRHPFL